MYIGDDFPELPDDQLVLYSMRFCPYAHRAHLVLDAKQIPHHVVNVHLKQKPKWLNDLNPASKVPILTLFNEPGAPNLAESLIIADYVDAKYPQRPLYPQDPLARATDRVFIDRSTTLAAAFYRVILFEKGGLEDTANEWSAFEVELARRGSKFFGGDRPGMVDYMVWPWAERQGAVEAIAGDAAKWDASLTHLVNENKY